MPARVRRLAGLAGAVAAVFLLAPHQLPLYDGVGFPDEPYRYVHPPAAAPTSPPPSSAHGTITIVHGTNPQGRTFGTDEMGPQVLVDLLAHGIHAPGAVSTVALDLVPAAVTNPPPDATPNSDVYDIKLSSPTGPITISRDGQGMFVTLRAVKAGPHTTVMAYRPGPTAPWKMLPTQQNGQDTFGADAPGPGQYLLVQPHDPASRTGQGHSSSQALLLTIGGILAAVALTLAGVRTMSRRATA